MSWAGGKGSNPRPFAVDEQTFADNWKRIFGAKPEGSPDKETKRYEPESESIASRSRTTEGQQEQDRG